MKVGAGEIPQAGDGGRLSVGVPVRVWILTLLGVVSGWVGIGLPAYGAPSEALPWGVRSWTAVEGLPDLSGQPQFRAEQQLMATIPLGGAFSVEGLGSVRAPATGPTTLDVLRLSGQYSGRGLQVGTGRLARTGIQGMEALDGAIVGITDMGARFNLWGGRLWHPEVIGPQDAAFQGKMIPYVTGGEATFRLAPLSGLEAGLGVEGRFREGRVRHRSFASLGLRGPREGTFSATGELGAADAAGERASRASMRTSLPVGRIVRAGAGLRWEELRPAGTVGPSALSWLAPDGYGAADLELGLNLGPAVASLSGGPTWGPNTAVATDPFGGGLGRGQVEVRVVGPLSVGGGGLVATAGGSDVVGALGLLACTFERLSLRTEFGHFLFNPQTGPAAEPWEARLSADGGDWVPRGALAAVGVRHLGLRALAGAGADRTLDPWVRAGLSLRGDFGGSSAGEP